MNAPAPERSAESPPRAGAPRTRGVYVLGNDHVADFLEALFASLRRHSPDLPVRLIPYDDRLTRTRELCRRHRITLHEDASFAALEQIGLNLWTDSPYPTHHRLFRRLCIFWGPFDDFLYLDADVCVLAPLEPLFAAFAGAPAPFASFDVDHERVYLPGPFRDRMIREHGSLGFNSGHFFSRRGALDLARLQFAGAAARPFAGHFQDRGDQGFLNFAVDHLRLPQVRMNSLVPALADKQWGEQKLRRQDGRMVIDRPGHGEDGKHLALIHWSGHSRPGWHLPNRALYYHYHGLGKSGLTALRHRTGDGWAHYLARLRPLYYRARIFAGRARRLGGTA